MALILRNNIGQALTWTQLDGNFTYLEGLIGTPSLHGTPSQVVYFDSNGDSTSDYLFVRVPGSYTDITTGLGSVTASYMQSGNFLGIGVTASGQVFNTGSVGINLIASLDQRSVGGPKDSTILGYLRVDGSGNESSVIQLLYDTDNDVSSIGIGAQNSNNTNASINIQSSTSSYSISFVYGGDRYSFPVTSPTPGTVLGYDSANTLGWVVGGGITGTGSSVGITYSVQLADGFGGFTSSGNFYYNKTLNTFKVNTPGTSNGGFLSDGTSGGQQMGDINGVGNKTLLTINDFSKSTIISTNGYFKVGDVNANTHLLADTNGGLYQLGSAILNSTKINIDDTFKIIKLDSKGWVYIGDITNSNNGSKIIIDDNTSTINMYTKGGVISIGDIDNLGNSTKLVIDDLTQLISMTNVPTYSNDSSAITAGLTSSNIYKKLVGSSTTLCIVP